MACLSFLTSLRTIVTVTGMKEKSKVIKTLYEQIVRCHACAKADVKQL